jgi:hypothetical protein
MLTLVMWVVYGWIVGNVAQWLVPVDRPTPGWETIALGIAGSIVGGMIAAILTGNGYHPAGVVFSVIGALVCLFGYRWYTGA